jgi:hypothetical protein
MSEKKTAETEPPPPTDQPPPPTDQPPPPTQPPPPPTDQPPPPTQPPSPTTASSVVKDILSNYKAALGLVGLAVYAIVRVAHDSFYSEFQLTPESVGLSQVIILSRAALYFGLLLSIILAVAGGWALFWYLIRQIWRAAHVYIVLPIQRWASNSTSEVSPRPRYHSHQPLMILFLLAAPLPLLVIYTAPYFVRFLFYGNRLPAFTLGWILLLCLALYWALRLGRFDRSDILVNVARILLIIVILAPLALSVLVFEPELETLRRFAEQDRSP